MNIGNILVIISPSWKYSKSFLPRGKWRNLEKGLTVRLQLLLKDNSGTNVTNLLWASQGLRYVTFDTLVWHYSFGSKWTHIKYSSLLWKGISVSPSENSFVTISTAFLSWAGRWQVKDNMISSGYLVSQWHSQEQNREAQPYLPCDTCSIKRLNNYLLWDLLYKHQTSFSPCVPGACNPQKEKDERGQQVENTFT